MKTTFLALLALAFSMQTQADGIQTQALSTYNQAAGEHNQAFPANNQADGTYKQTAIERENHYKPDGRDIVCINGSSRYTRALYGGPTEYRIETSDRPVFASYKKGDCRNISFRLTVGNTTVALDSTAYCEARYHAGRRDYTLTDPRWNGGKLRVSVIARTDIEGALWLFSTEGFSSTVSLEGRICETAVMRFRRFGEMGRMEKPGGFEASPTQNRLSVVKVPLKGQPVCVSLENNALVTAPQKSLLLLFSRQETVRKGMASQVEFNTPDAFINTIGGNMVMAADGAWDGLVWNHGAVGWRMPLPGWRAAYMGDFLGWPDRQRKHFDAYAKSQVSGVPNTIPHPTQDTTANLSRGVYRWGTPMYSDGYICRNPEKNHQFHHYDMNLVYIDELLWHFQFDADTTYMRQMWPVIKAHLAWEKLNWDPDNDGLYDAYCCIWASDALQYNSGGVAHSSAYNYRGNLLAARIAELIGEDSQPYRAEADKILAAMNSQLWLSGGYWAEFKDFMGLKRKHESAALWSVYTPIDCGACTPEQAYQATRYVDSRIPHIPFTADGKSYCTISTTDWMPYEWSINNVAMAEVLHTALAYYEAGRNDAAFELLKGTVMDFMYLGGSPGNFGQISYFDKAIGEAYRDFSDVTGIASRAFVQGLFGITPDALYERCIIRPGFPSSWDSASVKTPYLSYTFKREGGKETYVVRQNFKRPLRIVLRQNLGLGRFTDTVCSADSVQTIVVNAVMPQPDSPVDNSKAAVTKSNSVVANSNSAVAKSNSAVAKSNSAVAEGTAFDKVVGKDCRTVDISTVFNSNVTEIFTQNYLSPRSPYTTLCLPMQGIGDWCSPKKTAKIDDSGLRSAVSDGIFTAVGVPFSTPKEGWNVAFTSLWDNFPDSISVALKGKASHAYLLMAGSTNPMQSRIANAMVRIEYADGTSDTLTLTNPDNWCPIEQDYYIDGLAYNAPLPRPYRVGLATGKVSRTLFEDLNMSTKPGLADVPSGKVAQKELPGGAAQLLDMPLNPAKKLRRLVVRTLANDVVVGLMAVTLQK